MPYQFFSSEYSKNNFLSNPPRSINFSLRFVSSPSFVYPRALQIAYKTSRTGSYLLPVYFDYPYVYTFPFQLHLAAYSHYTTKDNPLLTCFLTFYTVLGVKAKDVIINVYVKLACYCRTLCFQQKKQIPFFPRKTFKIPLTFANNDIGLIVNINKFIAAVS